MFYRSDDLGQHWKNAKLWHKRPVFIITLEALKLRWNTGGKKWSTGGFICKFSPLQSGPNVPFGQHTLMVSMQNHLCRSGCFVFLCCNRKRWGLTAGYQIKQAFKNANNPDQHLPTCVIMCPSLIRSPLKSNHNLICIDPPLEPPSLKMLLVLLHHVVALKAAAVAQPLHDLHQPNLTGVEGKQQTRWVHKLVWDCKHTSQNVQEDLYLHEKKRKQLHLMESTEAQKPAGLVKSKQLRSQDLWQGDL